MTFNSPNRSRRRVLKAGLFGGLVLTIGGAASLALRSSRLLPAPAEGLRVLDAREYSVVHAIAGRVIPDRPDFPSIDQVRVALNVDRILERTDSEAQREVKQLFGVFENALAAFAFGQRVRPFTQLSPAEQDDVLAEWQNSRLVIRRTGFEAIRGLVVAGYYSSRLVWKPVGYGGPPQGFHQPDAVVWKGGAAPRPMGNGVFVDEGGEP
jgi:hypothetical protein